MQSTKAAYELLANNFTRRAQCHKISYTNIFRKFVAYSKRSNYYTLLSYFFYITNNYCFVSRLHIRKTLGSSRCCNLSFRRFLWIAYFCKIFLWTNRFTRWLFQWFLISAYLAGMLYERFLPKNYLICFILV